MRKEDIDRICNLADRLAHEVAEYDDREKFDRSAVSDIYTMVGAAKNLYKIAKLAEEDEEPSYSYRRDSMGRYARDRYARDGRDYMGARNISGTTYRGYSRNGDLMEKIQAMMEDEGTRRELQEMVERSGR